MAERPNDLQPPLRPRIAGRRPEADPYRVPALSGAVLQRLRGRFGGSAPRRSASRSKGTTEVPKPVALSRRCVVKARYVGLNARGREAARLHLLYLERDGVEADGSPGRLYGPDVDFKREDFVEPRPGEQRQFRFIVSPEDGDRLDLTDFTRQLMAQVEKDLGRRLVWAAVNHHDTDQSHVHVVIRGVDASGKDLRIPRRYCFEEMRWRAQELVTRELGLRTEREVRRQRTLEVDQERLTSIDRRIASLVTEDGSIGVKHLLGRKRFERALVLGRLAVLERLRLARKLPGGCWNLELGWQNVLAQLGERGDIIKSLHHAVAGEVGRYRIDPPGHSGSVEGVVRAKGLHDELTGELFAAVETAGGDVHYLRIDSATAADLAIGDIARVTVSREPWIKPPDRAIARVASLNAGVYDPVRHRDELRALQPVDAAVSAAALVAGNVRRLERLERYRLGERMSEGRWRIPPDLLEQLAARERSHPRARTRVEKVGPSLAAQIEESGPAWIDGVAAGEGRASWGFGDELTRAIQKRQPVVRERERAAAGEQNRTTDRNGPTRENP
jgi:type IV secretory pathway VirD2 relaxase